jgi:hypothetical protein
MIPPGIIPATTAVYKGFLPAPIDEKVAEHAGAGLIAGPAWILLDCSG